MDTQLQSQVHCFTAAWLAWLLSSDHSLRDAAGCAGNAIDRELLAPNRDREDRKERRNT